MSAHTTPPPQYLIPVPVKEMPIKMTVMDEMRGGNRRMRTRTGSKERHISSMPHTILVPSILGTIEMNKSFCEMLLI